MQETFQKIDVGIARQSLDSLHDHVVGRNKRIVISKAGSEDCAVLISQAELDGLEKALEILSNTQHGADLRDGVMSVISNVLASKQASIGPSVGPMGGPIGPMG